MTYMFKVTHDNVRNMCLEKYELDSVYFVSAPGLAW